MTAHAGRVIMLTQCGLMQISLAVPPTLKQQLVVDHDTIKKESKVVPLPRTPCVEEILTAYSKGKQNRGVVDSNAEQVANGLRTYFDRSLALVRMPARAFELL